MPNESGRIGESAGATLMGLIRAELVAVPVAHWGFFFPCQVAVWRFIERLRPGILGSVKARFDQEPVFEGIGAPWFCERLGANQEYLGLLERVMYPITRDMSPMVRNAVLRRGFFLDQEIPPLDGGAVESLGAVVLGAVDGREA